MLISPSLLFIHVPKTAGMSVVRFLVNSLDEPVVVVSPHPIHTFNMPSDDYASDKLQHRYGERHETPDEALVFLDKHGFDRPPSAFCVIRDPYDMMLSYYKHIRKPSVWKLRGMTEETLSGPPKAAFELGFDEFCEKELFWQYDDDELLRYFDNEEFDLFEAVPLQFVQSFLSWSMPHNKRFSLDNLEHRNKSSEVVKLTDSSQKTAEFVRAKYPKCTALYNQCVEKWSTFDYSSPSSFAEHFRNVTPFTGYEMTTPITEQSAPADVLRQYYVLEEAQKKNDKIMRSLAPQLQNQKALILKTQATISQKIDHITLMKEKLAVVEKDKATQIEQTKKSVAQRLADTNFLREKLATADKEKATQFETAQKTIAQRDDHIAILKEKLAAAEADKTTQVETAQKTIVQRDDHIAILKEKLVAAEADKVTQIETAQKTIAQRNSHVDILKEKLAAAEADKTAQVETAQRTITQRNEHIQILKDGLAKANAEKLDIFVQLQTLREPTAKGVAPTEGSHQDT